MNNLRLSDSNHGDSLEAAVQRFLAPMAWDLGQHVDKDNAKARYADRVLTLELPKKNSYSARKVQVQLTRPSLADTLKPEFGQYATERQHGTRARRAPVASVEATGSLPIPAWSDGRYG